MSKDIFPGFFFNVVIRESGSDALPCCATRARNFNKQKLKWRSRNFKIAIASRKESSGNFILFFPVAWLTSADSRWKAFWFEETKQTRAKQIQSEKVSPTRHKSQFSVGPLDFGTEELTEIHLNRSFVLNNMMKKERKGGTKRRINMGKWY